MSTEGQRSRGWIAIGCVAVGFIGLSWHLLDRCLDDDAFISFRYARHMLEGHGLVFNVGERVEGYTNFLWTVLCAAWMASGIVPQAGAQVMGIAFGTGSLILMYRLARGSGVAVWAAVAAPAALALTLPFAVEGLLGLEMPLYVCLSLVALWLWHGSLGPAPGARNMLTGAVFALTAMTRPEGIALFALSFVPELWPRGASPKHTIAAWAWRAWLARTAGFALVFGPYFAWRFSYYGYPLPNTFYAKAGGASDWLWVLGAEYVGSALVRSGPVSLLLVAAFASTRLRTALPRYASLAALWAAFSLIYLISVGGDFRPHYRFFVPLLAWSWLAAGAVLWLAPVKMPRLAARRALARVACAVILIWPAIGFYGPAMRWVRYREHRNPQLVAVGNFMKAYAEPGSLMAISGGGYVPYISQLPAIEMWGLTDLHIARVPARRIARGVPGHTKGDGSYILARKPKYVLFIALMATKRAPRPEEIGSRLAGPSEVDLWQSPDFHKAYRLRSVALPQGDVLSFFELR